MEKIFGIALVGLMVLAMLSSLPGTVNADKCVPIDETKLNDDEKKPFPLVKKYAEEQGVSPALLMAIIKQESSFDPNKAGDGGLAIGYMQVHWDAAYDAGYRSSRDTFEDYSEESKNLAREDWPTDGFDTDTNIKYGCGYLKICYDKHKDSSVYNNPFKNAVSAYREGWPHGPDKENEWYVNPVFQNYEIYGECPGDQWCEEGECVPEASTLVLFAVGLLSLVGYLGFRRKED
jgi:hypothetical protein